MTHPIGCREAVERLWGYLDGELDGTAHGAMEAHLAYCLRCCGELAFAREIRDVLRTRGAGDLPGGPLERLHAFIDRLDTATDTGATT
ncbi:MAG: zf-HC2 domain-containing protein [Actinobacteria bacterium]|nr:zf-HC2 domain-containing protein [Actinomycetota bacterium]